MDRRRASIDTDDPPSWIELGYAVSNPGLLLLIVATVLTGTGTRRTRRQAGGVTTLDRVATVLLAVSVVAYLMAIWAMTTKPT